MNYYEHHIGDFLKKTAHLSAVEDGVYRRLLDRYYTTEAPLPADVRECCKLARASTSAERNAVKAVLAEFFTLRDDGYHQGRADEEIARFKDKQRKAKASAEARWSKTERNANADANASADDMRTHSERNADGMHRAPVPSPQSPDPYTQAELAIGGGTAPSAAPSTPPEPAPPFDGNNAETLNGKAVVPLATTWDLPEQWGLDAEALGWQPRDVLREAEKFRQYWTAGRGTGTRRSVKGWRQSWSNWLEKAARDRR